MERSNYEGRLLSGGLPHYVWCNLECAQKDLLSVLLKYLRRTGLLSQFTYSQAEELVYSATGLSELLRYPVCAAEEANVYEYSQDPQ